MEKKFRESFTMHPYLQAIHREQRRNAKIKNEEKKLKAELAMDIPEEIIPVLKKVKAHLDQRTEKKTKTRWAMLIRKDGTETLRHKEKKHNWVRTEKLCFA